MKKTALSIIILFIGLHITIGQTNNKTEMYPIDKTKSYYLGNINLEGISLGVSVDTLSKVRSYANKFPNINNRTLTYIENGNRIQFDINCKQLSNIKNYRFLIVDELNNNLESGAIEDLTFTKHPFFGYSANLPTIDIQHKAITITVYNNLDPNQLGAATVYNKRLPETEIIDINKEVFAKSRQRTAVEMKKGVSTVTFDQESKGIRVVAKKNEYNFIYSLTVKEKKTGTTVFKDQAWNYNHSSISGIQQPYISIDKQYFKNAGEYEIIIQPDLKSMSAKELEKYSSRKTIYVDILKSYSTQEVIFWSTTLLIVCIGTTALLIYLIRRKNRQKIKNESLQKKIAEARLASIQSQLNPHFLFNALSSIQSFVNDNDVDNANRYLSKFARLTRHVLDSSTSTSLIDEINLLEDYLQMEQLRFGFQYKIQAKNLDNNNIEIPSMLLQPLVENAIKHGISELKGQGHINIDFDRHKNDLQATILDNGKGYNVAQVVTGFGIKLTNERIQLWNELHPQAPICINTISNSKGTSVYLTFKNWLS